jgi:hypothetical protein
MMDRLRGAGQWIKQNPGKAGLGAAGLGALGYGASRMMGGGGEEEKQGSDMSYIAQGFIHGLLKNADAVGTMGSPDTVDPSSDQHTHVEYDQSEYPSSFQDRGNKNPGMSLQEAMASIQNLPFIPRQLGGNLG